MHYRMIFGIESHVALGRNPGPGYDTLLLLLIPGMSPYRVLHTLYTRIARPFRQPDCTLKPLPMRDK